MQRSQIVSSVWWIIPVVVVVALIGFVVQSKDEASSSEPEVSVETQTERASQAFVQSCTTDMKTTFHIHPKLTILLNGELQTIPTDVGTRPGCMNPLHTHGTDGVIHVESPEKKDFTLGDFFLVWGKTFTKDQILDAVADETHAITMTVNGAASEEYENLVLNDKDEIVISYAEIK